MELDRNRIVAGGLLVLLAVAAYAPAFQAGWVIDDDNYITDNELLRDASGLKRIWTEPSASPQYYPLVYTGFWIQYQLWGLAPSGYHAVNILLHALNALLIFILLSRLRCPGALLAAALFAVHPVHVESVAWAAELKNVLSGAFYLLAALAYARFSGLDRSDDSRGGGLWFYLLSLLLFGAALLSKTATVSLPAALLLLIWWKRERVGLIRDLLPLLPMFVLGLGLGLITLRIETTTVGASGELWDLSFPERLIVAGRAFWFYLAKLVWPVGLSFSYERWTIDGAVGSQYLWPLTALAAFAGLWFARKRIGRGPLVAMLFFAGTLAPTLGFFNVYFFRYAYVADHFQYLASIGPFALLAGLAVGLVEPAGRIKPRVARAVTAVLLAALATLTWAHARSYESLETLCLEILREHPGNWLGNNNLGNLHMQRGELETALEYFNVAHKTAPTYIETHLNLSIALMNLGRLEEAALHARRAIELRPTNTFGYVTLGEVLLREDKPGEAEGWFRQSLLMTPELPRALRGLAVSMGMLGRYDEAIALFERALRDDPDNPTLLRNLETARQAAGR